MTATEVHAALLRPAVLQVLRAQGFNYAKPAVVDTITDLAARYLLLLASSAAKNAFNSHQDYVPTVQDVRLAIYDAGGLRPQMSAREERRHGEELVDGEMVPFEDLRGVREFLSWARGPANKEIRRIAGFDAEAGVEGAVVGLDEQEDYVTALKRKHSKTGEESRYQGTVLGKDSEPATISIVGGEVDSISEWIKRREKEGTPTQVGGSPLSSAISSAPPTPEEPETSTPAAD